MRAVNYLDGQTVRVGDTVSYTLADGSQTTALITGINQDGVVKYGRNGQMYYGVPRVLGMVLVSRASTPVKAGSGKYIGTTERDGYKIDCWRMYPADKEKETMKKAYKAYIIEVDKDGNHVKMLHESIVFAVNKEKAELAVVIEATQGGVVDANTNFVVSTTQLS